MRRMVLLLALMAGTVMVAAGPRGGGIENNKVCNNVPCYGTAQNVLLVEPDRSVKARSVKARIFGVD